MTASELSAQRLEICRQCPLYKETSNGPICNPKLFLSKDGKVSYLPKEGYVKGCSCRLLKKTRNASLHCPAEKW